ncbi:MAG TPA: PAS domain S-box protein [Anaerolineales bacterium]|nr:PAS domain S-box protein [Anaerolineales bacterium]
MKATTKKSKNEGKNNSRKPSVRESKSTPAKRVRPLAPKQFVDIIEHMNDGVVVLDKDWHYVYVNQKATIMLQRQKPSDLIGRHIWTEYPEGVGQPFQLAYEKAMREQIPIVFEDHYEPWDLWFENRIYPSPEGLLILFTEISDRKRIESLLNERQYFLQKILDTEPGTVYIYDLEERRNVYVNRFWLLAFGYTEEETQAMGNQLLNQIIHPDDLTRVLEHHEIWRQASNDDLREIDYRVQTKTGEWRWLHSREVPFARDEVGNVKQILGITHDITVRKQVEKALRESEEKFSKVFYASPIPLSINRASDGRYVEVNGSFLERSGFQREEVIGHTAQEMGVWVNPAEREKMRRILREQGSLRDFEGQFRTKSGRVGTALLFREIIELAGEKHFIGTSLDITERKRMEEALRESEKRYQLISTVASDYMFSTQLDADGRLTLNWVTGAFESITGYTLEEYVAHGGWRSTLHPDDLAIDDRDLENLRANKPVISEVRTFTKDGKLVWVRVYAQPVLDVESKKLTGIYGAVQDITDRKRAEEGLRQLNEELEGRIAARTEELAAAMIRAQESDRLKSAFLATMSHELRTPLNSIIGFTGVILRGLAGPLNDEQNIQLGMIRDSAHHLLALINDVLDISKIEAGQLEIIKRPFNMRQAIESVLRIVQPLADKKNLQLGTIIGTNIDTITNDRRRVEQVLINLVNNAIKFTERGEVSIECQIRDGWLETSVRDSGIGIKPEDVDRLFKPFQQIDTGLARSHDGTGLGLAICKRLVTLMGGEITVESQWGIGSTFKFTLPI